MPVILATWETEIEKTVVLDQSGKKVYETLLTVEKSLAW
jgi:hypothetical protein